MTCPDANLLQALVAGDISEAEREQVSDHTDSCEDCRALLAAIVVEARDDSERLPYAATVEPAGQATASSPALADLPEGTRVGRYAISELLGKGGLGVVYAAHDPELGRRVALKLLRTGRGLAQELLVREAKAMARVAHPNVLSVFEVGRWNDRVFVAMELVSGTDLREWLTQPRTLREIVDVFRLAGEGLSAAHAAGVVHRDFKPDNVLIANDGQVRVTDFGLARAPDPPDVAGDSTADSRADSGEGDPLRTRAGKIVGTPSYMAPEQHEAGVVDPRSDQFGFCASLYEAVYGQRAFAGTNYAELRETVLAGRVRPAPRDRRVPTSLRRILLRGLARDPAARWPTMQALLAALGRDRSRLPRRIAVLAAVVLGLIVTVGVSDWILRTRLYASARTSFEATRDQIDRALDQRFETFAGMAELGIQLPILREVAATRDLADFGLGKARDDDDRLSSLHWALRDADWTAWSAITRRGEIAIADAKGRLLYSTGNVRSFGGDIRRLPPAQEAYRESRRGAAVAVMRADDPDLVASGVVPGPRSGLLVVFARAAVLAGVHQAVFVQTMTGRSFLEDLRPLDDTHLALVAPDGSSDGDVPREVVSAAADTSGEVSEVTTKAGAWLRLRVPVPGIRPGKQAIAHLVMARSADIGLAGLFPHARGVLSTSGAISVLILLAALWQARVQAGRASRPGTPRRPRRA